MQALRRRPLAVAEHDRNQAVAAVLRAAGVLDFALNGRGLCNCRGEKDNHGVGRLEGACHLARIVTGQSIPLVRFT